MSECHSVIRERSRRYGQTSKDRDLAKWTKTRRRMVRREDILSSITGKSPPARQTPSFSRHSLGRNADSFSRSRNSPQRRSPRPSTSNAQTIKPRRNSLFNKDLSHLQVRTDQYHMRFMTPLYLAKNSTRKDHRCFIGITVCKKSWLTIFSWFQRCGWFFNFHCRWLVKPHRENEKVSHDFLHTVYRLFSIENITIHG